MCLSVILTNPSSFKSWLPWLHSPMTLPWLDLICLLEFSPPNVPFQPAMCGILFLQGEEAHTIEFMQFCKIALSLKPVQRPGFRDGGPGAAELDRSGDMQPLPLLSTEVLCHVTEQGTSAPHTHYCPRTRSHVWAELRSQNVTYRRGPRNRI